MRAHFERESDLEAAWTGYNASMGRPLLNTSKFLAPKAVSTAEPGPLPEPAPVPVANPEPATQSENLSLPGLSAPANGNETVAAMVETTRNFNGYLEQLRNY